MSKVVLDNVTGGYALSVINDNFQKVEDALNNQVLYRDNVTGEPNAMSDDLDMNSKRIYNLPTPLLANEAARLQDVQNAISGANTANLITFVPVGSVSSTNVQAAIQEIDSDLTTASSFIAEGAGAVSRSMQTKVGETVSVKDFGATGNGTTDDTEAIRLACTAIAAKGGSVIFPVPGIYKITSEIAITSDYPVVLESWMGPNNSASPGSYISVGAAIAGAVFNISSRGGAVRGLWFRDPTSVLGVSQGTRAINQALKLTLFGMGTVDGCAFDGLLGSAIETISMIRGRILDPHIRDCGTPTRPVIYLNGTSSGVPSQAVVIANPHIETCYGEYIHINQYSPDCKVIGGQFEADTAIAATNQYFIYNNGDRTKVDSCGFNRNTAISFYGNASRAQLSNCSFNAASGVSSAARVHLAGAYNQLSNCEFNGTSADTGTSINDAGGNNFFTGCHVYFGGNVILGASSVWTGGGCYDLNTTQTYAITCGTNSTVSGAVVSSCNVSGGIITAGGVMVTGCNVFSNAGIGILCNSASAVIVGNRASANTGGDLSFSAYPHGYDTNANYAGDGLYPLQASMTWNPGSIANGASASQNITVTGAANGDFADAQFPMLVGAAAQDGMQLSASVYTANSVKVTITNASGGAVDLDSGTLRVKVTKA